MKLGQNLEIDWGQRGQENLPSPSIPDVPVSVSLPPFSMVIPPPSLTCSLFLSLYLTTHPAHMALSTLLSASFPISCWVLSNFHMNFVSKYLLSSLFSLLSLFSILFLLFFRFFVRTCHTTFLHLLFQLLAKVHCMFSFGAYLCLNHRFPWQRIRQENNHHP